MADIPVIPGVSVTPMGILNRPIKDIICAILFGGINNMLKGNLLCVNLDLEKLLDEPIVADIKAELTDLKNELKAMEEASGIKDVLGRVNQGIAEVQNLLALDGLCKIPLKCPPIPDILNMTIDAEFATANAILDDIGRLEKPKLCINGAGGLNTGSYNPSSILGRIQSNITRLGTIPGHELDILKRQLTRVTAGLKASLNRQLFPDFRHKTDLTTGRPYAKGGAGVILASAAEQTKLKAKIAADSASPAGLLAWQQVANMPGASAADIQASYPPGDASLKDAVNIAQTLVGGMKKTASYPSTANGIINANMWPGVLGPDIYAMAVQAMSPQDPLFVQQDPLYDYCGKFIGYNETVITGDSAYKGGDPKKDAVLNPHKTNFEFNWIADRQCWAVTGVQSEQVVNGRKDTYLDANPEIELHRGYSHILSVPSADISGFVMSGDYPTATSTAPEFFICRVGNDLRPLIANGEIVKFNMGLSRLETSEVLDNANGWLPSETEHAGIDGPEGYNRRLENPMGTTLYFSVEQRQYSGTVPPLYPSKDIWWYNPTTLITQQWIPDGEASGQWVVVSDQDRNNHWYGSSPLQSDISANYLAYSNRNGSVFGLLKLI